VATTARVAARSGEGATTGMDQRPRGRGCSWCASKRERRKEGDGGLVPTGGRCPDRPQPGRDRRAGCAALSKQGSTGGL
jgi:hypothetical protein